MLEYKNYLSYPDYPLTLTIEDNTYRLEYGAGQTVFKKKGSMRMTESHLILDRKKHLLVKNSSPIFYFTGYQFVFCDQVFQIENFIVDELLLNELVFSNDVEKLNFMKDKKISHGRWYLKEAKNMNAENDIWNEFLKII